MKEFERFSLTHDQNTAVDFYVDRDAKKGMSLAVNAWFRSKYFQPDEFEDNGEFRIFISESQDEYLKIADEELEAEKLSTYLDRVRTLDSETQPSLQKTITSVERVALLELFVRIQESGLLVTNVGDPLDIFLSGNPVVNNQNVSILSRMFTLAPSSWKCKQKLEQNLLLYASLRAGEGAPTPRELKVTWIEKLLQCLKHIRTGGSVDHPVVISIFAKICKEYGFGYCMKNKALLNQVKIWLDKADLRRKDRENIDVKRKTLTEALEDIDERVQGKSDVAKKCLVPPKKSWDRVESDFELNQGGLDCQLSDLNRPPKVSEAQLSVDSGLYHKNVPEDNKRSADVDVEDDKRTEICTDVPIEDPVSSGIDSHIVLENEVRRDIGTDSTIPYSEFAANNSPIVVNHEHCIVTPVKVRFGLKWTDSIKKELLKSYVKYCSNPMCEGVKEAKQHGYIKKQCVELKNVPVGGLDGDIKLWKEVTTVGTIHDKIMRQV